MKKASSIILSVFMLLALFHFVVATHYCHGNVIASKVSLSGKISTCNMTETVKDDMRPGLFLNSSCCNNTVKFFGVDNNYFPSSYSIPAYLSLSLHSFTIQNGLKIHFTELSKGQYTGESPPGVLMSTNVDLSNICVFRI